MEDSEGTVRQIGAFSEGISNLTVRQPHNIPAVLYLLWSLLFLPQFLLCSPEHAKRGRDIHGGILLFTWNQRYRWRLRLFEHDNMSAAVKFEKSKVTVILLWKQ